MHKTILLLSSLLLFSHLLFAQENELGPITFQKPTDKDQRQVQNVNNLQLTVTNFGILGTRNAFWPQQFACEYPRGSRIENLYQGGIYFGAISRLRGRAGVSTGCSDRSGSGVTGLHYEFSSEPDSFITKRSTDPFSGYPTTDAISELDFVSTYTDKYTKDPITNDTIPYHMPLGISVHQESYAWSLDIANSFIIIGYTFTNTGYRDPITYKTVKDTLDSVYVGLWNNFVVKNTNYVRPGSTGYFNIGSGYDSVKRLAYAFDFDGNNQGPPTGSYISMKLLGSLKLSSSQPYFPNGVNSTLDLATKTYFNAWKFRSGDGDNTFFSPVNDDEDPDRYKSRYARMTSSIPTDKIATLKALPTNVTLLLSTGPFKTLEPDSSFTVFFAIVAAKKYGQDAARFDTPEQRKNLYTNADWAQKAYDGEDANGNDILDEGEDFDGDGKITRFSLPKPPRRPKVRVEVGSNSVTLYWDKSTSEESIDPISQLKDFEGYRIYRSNAGADITAPEELLTNMSLIAEYDKPGDSLFFDVGFSQILLPEAKKFPGDTVDYWYRFPPPEMGLTHLNGWQYMYGITAFDKDTLETSKVLKRVIPGVVPNSNKSTEIGVYPNPYYTSAYWEGSNSSERNRKIIFYNLPASCQIRIYTLAGDIVATIDHDAATYTGSDIQWFQKFETIQQTPEFSGGEHAWDLISKSDQAIATGLYLFSVKDNSNGDIRVGKFLVIK
jgi:hypothetical protein